MMKKATTILILLLAVISLSAQDISGTWKGALVLPQGELRIHFNITATDDGYTSTLDSPDQNANGIPVDTTFFKAPELTIKAIALDLVYVGTLEDKTTINGTLTQMGQKLELNLKKETE